jgi:hypothetical protein
MKRTNKTFMTAVLLVAALITSCAEPTGVGDHVGYQPPDGMGYATVSIPGIAINERSILPGAPGAFTQYDFTFEKFAAAGGGTATDTITKSAVTSLSAPQPLNPGYYELTVTAYTGTGTPIAVAEGTSARFQISAGSATPVTVSVTALDFATGDGTGTFTYTISNPPFGPSSITAFTMTITNITGNTGYANDGTAQNILSSIYGSKQTLTLPTGSYSVVVTLETDFGTASRYDILYVYQGLTSDATYTFTAGNFPGGVNISVNYENPPDAKPELSYSGGAIADNATITAASGTTITVGNAGTFNTVEWFCNSGAPFATAGTYTITDGTDGFNAGITYNVTVVGKKADGTPNSTRFTVEVQ